MDRPLGYVLISAQLGKEGEVFTGLGKCKKTDKTDAGVYVEEAHPIFGEYDFIAKVSADTVLNLGDFVVEKIRAIPGVTNTRTLLSFMLPEGLYKNLPNLDFLDQ